MLHRKKSKLYTFLFLAALTLLSAFSTTAQQKDAAKPRTFKMGEYTMKQYYFVMLIKGPRRDEVKDTAAINRLQEGHMANMDRMAKMGKLMTAGPFGDDGNWRGIFILDCETEQEAKDLLATDPMIKAGRLAYEMHPWWTAMNAVFK
ncbi:MAG: YciI family protein [Bacteroidota bacterium]